MIELPASECQTLVSSLVDSTTEAPLFDGETLTLPKGADFRGYALLFKK